MPNWSYSAAALLLFDPSRNGEEIWNTQEWQKATEGTIYPFSEAARRQPPPGLTKEKLEDIHAYAQTFWAFPPGSSEQYAFSTAREDGHDNGRKAWSSWWSTVFSKTWQIPSGIIAAISKAKKHPADLLRFSGATYESKFPDIRSAEFGSKEHRLVLLPLFGTCILVAPENGTRSAIKDEFLGYLAHTLVSVWDGIRKAFMRDRARILKLRKGLVDAYKALNDRSKEPEREDIDNADLVSACTTQARELTGMLTKWDLKGDSEDVKEVEAELLAVTATYGTA